eukprot:4905235-Pyramimonas_sp.AAC.1
MGKHELLAELIEAADTLHGGGVSEVGVSLLRGCRDLWSRELEGGESSQHPGAADGLPLPPPARAPYEGYETAGGDQRTAAPARPPPE